MGFQISMRCFDYEPRGKGFSTPTPWGFAQMYSVEPMYAHFEPVGSGECA